MPLSLWFRKRALVRARSRPNSYSHFITRRAKGTTYYLTVDGPRLVEFTRLYTHPYTPALGAVYPPPPDFPWRFLAYDQPVGYESKLIGEIPAGGPGVALPVTPPSTSPLEPTEELVEGYEGVTRVLVVPFKLFKAQSLPVGTTPTKLIGFTWKTRAVMVQNDPTSANDILVGGDPVLGPSAIRLTPGSTATLEIDDASKIYVAAVSGTALVRWGYFK